MKYVLPCGCRLKPAAHSVYLPRSGMCGACRADFDRCHAAAVLSCSQALGTETAPQEAPAYEWDTLRPAS